MRCAVLGAGNWGSIFGMMIRELGNEVVLWEYDRDRAKRLAQTRDNRPFLEGSLIPEDILVTSDLERALEKADVIILAIPSQTVAGWVGSLPTDKSILSLVKGIDYKRRKTTSQILNERIDSERIAVLAGPSIANEVFYHHPTTVVIASTSEKLAQFFQKNFSSQYFRIYTSTDVIGIEIGGAYKNTLAIGCGICDGLGYGSNAKAALITRGLSEMKRFAVAFGGRGETIFGLAGLGDLITTAFSPHSRNRRFGAEIGRGKDPEQIAKEMVMVAEGYYSTPAIVAMAEEAGINLPIAQAIFEVIVNKTQPLDLVKGLMLRPLRPEEG